MDLLAIPETNIECDLNKTKLLIEGYNLVKLENKLARLCCYVRENLIYKELKLNTGEISAIWIEIGENQNKWIVGSYYREFKIIGENGSETFESQKRRFDIF